ncbi:unnamed protein product [Urochloa humidicola]
MVRDTATSGDAAAAVPQAAGANGGHGFGIQRRQGSWRRGWWRSPAAHGSHGNQALPPLSLLDLVMAYTVVDSMLLIR